MNGSPNLFDRFYVHWGQIGIHVCAVEYDLLLEMNNRLNRWKRAHEKSLIVGLLRYILVLSLLWWWSDQTVWTTVSCISVELQPRAAAGDTWAAGLAQRWFRKLTQSVEHSILIK